MKLILASGSAARQRMLRNAGLDFAVHPADIDERAAEAPLAEAGAAPEDLAALLAAVKAGDVSARFPEDLVIGSDQVLDLDGEHFSKPEDMEAARRQLLALSGRTHQLHSAVAVTIGEEIVWQHVATASLTMRDLPPAFVGHYLSAAGPEILGSVGAYHVEGRGIQLFDRIEGDFFTIQGLPLLPLLQFLRAYGVLS
ncbi:septum formation protein [Faunimonas pinastri]|uniref:Nucleoside triphosphate pyrophosphatase n=1 Tax=Faunimonas pinastri TaxID=1855383 RepID=A0A1H9GWW1_9HYPH|nr:Maf family protein [Faunimonas pinastri]SEQ54483.1 septum formation protein [Faunimonas pinastri]